MITTSRNLQQDPDPAHVHKHPLLFSRWSMHILTKVGTVVFSL